MGGANLYFYRFNLWFVSYLSMLGTCLSAVQQSAVPRTQLRVLRNDWGSRLAGTHVRTEAFGKVRRQSGSGWFLFGLKTVPIGMSLFGLSYLPAW